MDAADEYEYPANVTTPERRRRWRLAEQRAEEFETHNAQFVHAATRALYNSDIPTGDGDPFEVRNEAGRSA